MRGESLIAGVADEIQAGLERAESLTTGRGALDLGGFVRGTGDGGVAGAGMEYSHRLTKRASAFGRAELGWGWGDLDGLNYGAIGGVRLRF